MKINFNNFTNTNNQNQFRKNTSFRSVMPVKVFVDGKISTDAINHKRALRQLTTILFETTKGNPTFEEIHAVFKKFVKDYVSPQTDEKKSELFRNRILDGVSYFFTGKQAENLDTLGKKIGPAKHKGLALLNTTKTAEAGAFGKDYAKKTYEYINTHSAARVRKTRNAQKYEGPLMGLCIFTTSNGKLGKKGCKLALDGISFREIKDGSVIDKRYV